MKIRYRKFAPIQTELCLPEQLAKANITKLQNARPLLYAQNALAELFMSMLKQTAVPLAEVAHLGLLAADNARRANALAMTVFAAPGIAVVLFLVANVFVQQQSPEPLRAICHAEAAAAEAELSG